MGGVGGAESAGSLAPLAGLKRETRLAPGLVSFSFPRLTLFPRGFAVWRLSQFWQDQRTNLVKFVNNSLLPIGSVLILGVL